MTLLPHHDRTADRSTAPYETWYAAEGTTLYILSGGGRSSDWVLNLLADPAVLVEIDGDERPARGRILESGDESERARSLVFAKYAPRYQGDLTDWRERALPVAVDPVPSRAHARSRRQVDTAELASGANFWKIRSRRKR